MNPLHTSQSGYLAALLAILFTLAAGAARAQSPAAYTDLHDFGGTVIKADGTSGPDGIQPVAGVTLDSAGNMYGTTAQNGMVWELTTSGTYKDLHDFGVMVNNANGTSGPDGTDPVGDVTFDISGNMYGTAESGGQYGYGMVWEITTSGTYKDLHDFGGTVTLANGKTGMDGYEPYAGVTLDHSVNIFGTTVSNVWEITASGAYKDLHDFGGTVTNANGTIGPDGGTVFAGVTLDSAGNMYGTASMGGPDNINDDSGGGIIWEITSSGTYKDLHDFGGTVTNTNGTNGPDGTDPWGSVAFDSAGNMYGTARNGGAISAGNPYGAAGMVWEITASGTYKDLHDFGGPTTNADGASGLDGWSPQASVTFDSAGNMYGTTGFGGGIPLAAWGTGILWEITESGDYLDLHDFGGTAVDADGTIGPAGFLSYSPVSLDKAGNMYGTLSVGGAYETNGDYGGLIWRISGAATVTPPAHMPTISPPAGSYKSAQSVTITDTVSAAAIYYTTDGATPTTFSTLYDGPITVLASETIKAIAVASGYTDSPVATAAFTLPPVAAFGPGLQLISLPYEYPGISLDTLFGYTGVKLAVWDPAGIYLLSPTPPADQVALGQAYWVRFPEEVTVTLIGTPASPLGPFDIPLDPGWHMIGNPFPTAVPVSSLTFNHGTESFSQATTSSSPLIGATVWGFATGLNQYEPATSLEPNTGYWMYVDGETDVEVPPGP